VIAGLSPVFGMGLHWFYILLIIASVPLVLFILYTAVVCYLFLPTIIRVFEEAPMFVPPNEPPDPDAKNVRFQAADGRWLQGSWLRATCDQRQGTIVFCHEFLANRWSCRPYCEALRSSGYEIFTFDFRNHGESETQPGYAPTQWASQFELLDLRAALAHVQSHVDDATNWIALLGVSRGGSSAVLAAAVEPCVRAVVTDGAFPTNLLQLAYMNRWAKIYIGDGLLYQLTPDWYHSLFCGVVRMIGARRRGCRFLRVARAIRRVSPRPLLMIHGAKDSYITPDVAEQLYRRAGEPKEFWLVPGAKHNQAIQVAGESYGQRVVKFFSLAKQRSSGG